MVPRAGIEPARPQGSRDFKSSPFFFISIPYVLCVVYCVVLRVVPGTGFEPVSHCWRQILSLLCIPSSTTPADYNSGILQQAQHPRQHQ